VARALADAFIQAQRHTDALALSEELLKSQGDDASFLFLKGRAEFGLKWYRQAKESFEGAARKAPGDPDIQSFLGHTSSLLGEGANSAIKEAIAPVPVPVALLGSAPPAPSDYARDDGAYYARRLTAISFTKGKELRTTDYVIVRTINAAGVSAFSTFQLVFNPLNESLFINRLEVRAPDGSLVSTGRVSDFYVLDDRTTSIVSYRKVLNMPVSGLQPGYSVELLATRLEVGTLTEFPFLAHSFSRPFPVRESVLFLCGDTGAVCYAASPTIDPERLGEGLCWRYKEPPVFRLEPMLFSATWRATLPLVQRMTRKKSPPSAVISRPTSSTKRLNSDGAHASRRRRPTSFETNMATAKTTPCLLSKCSPASVYVRHSPSSASTPLCVRTCRLSTSSII
jgi:hypothetical protein